jgi:transposase
LEVIRSTVPAGASVLYTDDWGGYAQVEAKLQTKHATVKHGSAGTADREWARDDDGDGIREVHCNSCEGAGTGVRTFLRSFRGVHKKYLADYMATYETMINAKSIGVEVVRRMCFIVAPSHSKTT